MLIQVEIPCKWANDSKHLLLEYFDIIHSSPSEIYHSALPFSPSSSWFHKYYSAELLSTVKVVKGLPTEWGICSRTVSLDSTPLALSYWNNTIAVGSWNRKIFILDATTGSQAAVLSGHTDYVQSIAFSSDGRLLVSGSDDMTVKLWDMQTGGVVKTFSGHANYVLSVSISPDCTMIASGSDDWTTRLWNVQSGKCHCVIEQQSFVVYVSISPRHPQYLISISGGKVWQWDFNGHQIPPVYDGTHIAFSPDHTQFALCNGDAITVQNSDSRATVTEFHVADSETEHCCFSPDGRLVAAAAGRTVYIWDITSPNPHLVGTFAGHTDIIHSLVFSSPSTLISASEDDLVKFWEIEILSTDSTVANPQSTSLALLSTCSVSLQARAGVAVSAHADGVVKTWDISTGLCKTTFQIPDAQDIGLGNSDTKLVDGRLIFVWYEDEKIYIWDTGKEKLLQTLHPSNTSHCRGLRISGDGSKVLSLHDGSIQAWSMWTWEPVGEVKLELEGKLCLGPLYTEDSRIWVQPCNSSIQEGWDFGTSGSSPVPFDPSTGRPQLDFIGGAFWQTYGPSWIKDTVTGKKVFQLSGKYAKPYDVQWDGQYLVAGYESGEVLILDFRNVSQ